MKNLRLNIMQVDVVSNQGYIYPKDVMEKAIDNFNAKYNDDNLCLCDNDGISIETDLAKITHSMGNLRMDDEGTISAEINVLDTTHGKILQDVLDSGVKMTAYSKGIATVDSVDSVDTISDYRYLGSSVEPVQEK